jgi:hypothetical protein
MKYQNGGKQRKSRYKHKNKNLFDVANYFFGSEIFCKPCIVRKVIKKDVRYTVKKKTKRDAGAGKFRQPRRSSGPIYSMLMTDFPNFLCGWRNFP